MVEWGMHNIKPIEAEGIISEDKVEIKFVKPSEKEEKPEGYHPSKILGRSV